MLEVKDVDIRVRRNLSEDGTRNIALAGSIAEKYICSFLLHSRSSICVEHHLEEDTPGVAGAGRQSSIRL
jgi:hypothetical protein